MKKIARKQAVANQFKRNRSFQIISAVIVISAVAILGYHLLSTGHAQTPFSSTYAANGTLSTPASLISGGSNSNSQAVQFGSTSSSGSSGSAIFGIYHDNSTIADLTSFQTSTGIKPILNEVYEDGNTSSEQSYISSSNFSYTGDAGTSYRLLIGMNMCANNNGTVEGSFADGAAGDYNSAYQTFAQNMVNAGFGDAIIRIGVEVYGNWESCYISNSTDAANFAMAYQQAVTAMRSVAGQSFKFDWEVAVPGNSSYTAAEAYPGDSYVDYIGFDTYDETWNGSCGYPFKGNATSTQSQCAWTSTILPSLTTVANFAAAHNKQIAIPEWGESIRSDGGGLYDDPTFIDNMANWITSHNVGFDIYFESDSGGQQDDLTDGSFPNSLAEMKVDAAQFNK